MNETKRKTNSPSVHVSKDWDEEERKDQERLKAYKEKQGVK
jgi:hypothetical protein